MMKLVLSECSKKFRDLKSDERAKDELYDLLSFMKWFLKQSFCENKFLHDNVSCSFDFYGVAVQLIM